MSDVTFGVKMPEELKNDLNKLIQESGLVGKDFMQTIINTYQVEKTKEQLPTVAQDLKELQGLTQRINNIYLSLGYRIDNITKAQQEQSRQELIKKDSIISDLQGKVNGLESDKETITEAYNNSVTLKDESNKRVNELTNMYSDNKLLVEEYKGKNDMLLGQMKQYEKYPEQLEATKELLLASQSKVLKFNSDLREREASIFNLNEDIKILKNNHKSEIIKIIEKSDFEKEKALLNKDREDQAIINKINQENNIKIKELLQENQLHNEKISKLMEESQIKSNEINGKDIKIKELILQVESVKELNKVKK